jgi:hypothetical protein
MYVCWSPSPIYLVSKLMNALSFTSTFPVSRNYVSWALELLKSSFGSHFYSSWFRILVTSGHHTDCHCSSARCTSETVVSCTPGYRLRNAVVEWVRRWLSWHSLSLLVCFRQSLQANSRSVSPLKLGHYRFLLHPFLFISHPMLLYSELFNDSKIREFRFSYPLQYRGAQLVKLRSENSN